ncbi:LacI family DNA-binding transcriptional regulator [Fusobacterium sp.]|uniref:LacI family DNA-binding transcriptional regulator n=1 Tax=Fusobacterium sp. TaxID=68766 RepID=UPI00290486BF|nr:LacI family DNA-binding transcriptional regulator [Fusobacterium sp.]MDU1910373.1 LacI family DNA-binding transcriptional regulator [Fusobacterium sp.]
MVTINDVARAAGVSRGTVSNVINNVKVREKSYIAVKKAIEELGYVPNQYARALKTNRTYTVALIIPTIWNPFFSELTFYVEKELRKRGYRMFLCNSDDDYRIEVKYLSMAKGNKVDGIICVTYSEIEEYMSSHIPMVSLEREFNDDIPYITCDNTGGGRLAAEKLIEFGCRNLICIGRSSSKNKAVKDRVEGFKEYCIKNSISHNIYFEENIKEDFDTWIKEYIKDRFGSGKKADGIFTVTDRYAERVIDILEKYGVKVPDDVQVIGYDGAKSYKNEIIKITTIRQPIEKMAEEAVRVLDNLILKNSVEKIDILPVSFIQGKTARKI